MIDGGEQQEAAEDGEQHQAAGGEQHLGCRASEGRRCARSAVARDEALLYVESGVYMKMQALKAKGGQDFVSNEA